MTVKFAKSALSIGWLVAICPLVIILVLRQQSGFFGADSDLKDVWGWFSQYVLPALTLLGGAWTVAAAPNDANRLDNPAIFWIAIALSIFYVALLYIVIASLFGAPHPMTQLKNSSLFLGIFQALVIGVIGKFFIESGR